MMLSRIVEHKNPHLLVEALAGLTEMRWRLSIFGDGPDRERLQARTPAELRDRVQWRGWSAGPGRHWPTPICFASQAVPRPSRW
ncbi:glycosyl transferases group 1 family protein [Mycobacterium kansasii]|uniref:Glycosyl transferases group 1 family protein n=1 Tax=Mycobacterium kansasii TaxID=1768 RepID=A0A1V3XNC0_MYCKA|nr:glycosyl transferases group 1 family protein [Mycobacterium kansasii]